MTVYELQLALADAIDKTSNASAPELTFQQKDRLLNNAIERFIRQRYGTTNAKQQPFESTQKRTDDLSNLTKYATLNTFTSGEYVATNVASFVTDLPADYWFSLSEIATINKTTPCVQTFNHYIKAIQHNQLGQVLNDPFNKPEDYYTLRVIYSDKLHILVDSRVTLSQIKLAYLSAYQKLRINGTYNRTPGDPLYYQTLEFWFNPHTHQEIANIAAEIYLEQVADPRYQTILNQNINQE